MESVDGEIDVAPGEDSRSHDVIHARMVSATVMVIIYVISTSLAAALIPENTVFR